MSAPASGVALASDGGRQTVVARLVGVALVIRLLTLVAGMVGLVGSELTPVALVAVLLLAATSFVGLLSGRALEVVLRHPGLAMVDVLLVLGVLFFLGVGSPLTLATFSTALLVGVLFPAHLAALLGFSLACGYVLALQPRVSAVSIDGGSFFVVVGVPVTYACLVGIGQSFRWIASRQAEAERALRDVRAAAAAGEERTRLAREMHDSFAKTLQGIALGASALTAWVHRDPEEAARQAKALGAAAEQAVQEARSLLSQLRRDRPEEPFLDVLELTTREWAERHGIPCHLQGALPRDPTPPVRYQLLAAMTEALDNAGRHARASSVQTTVGSDGSDVVIDVTDNGIGFDHQTTTEREREGHFGLLGMHERMADVGGSVLLRSASGHGTTVTLRAPMRREAEDAERIR